MRPNRLSAADGFRGDGPNKTYALIRHKITFFNISVIQSNVNTYFQNKTELIRIFQNKTYISIKYGGDKSIILKKSLFSFKYLQLSYRT